MAQTPKEKAAYLVVKYMSKVVHMRLAIECAFVAVDELIDEASQKIHTQGRCMLSDKEYWQEVKKEIELL